MKALAVIVLLCLLVFVSAVPANNAKATPSNGAACPMCEFVVTYLEKFINASEPEIVQAVEKVCDIVPNNFQAMCQGFISAYGQDVINYIIAKEPPAKLCETFGLCQRAVVAVKPAASDLECTFCKYIIGEAENFVNSSSSQQEVEAVLMKVCAMIPAPLVSTCDNYVTMYYPIFVNYLVNKLSPEAACEAATLCAKSSALVKVAAPAPNDLKCVACEYIMSLIENTLANNATEAKLVALLDKVCTYLPSALTGECEAIVSQYAPLIIQLVINDVPPAKICSTLGLCARTTVAQVATAQPNDVKCAVCEWIMSELESLINSQSTQAEIEAALDKVCEALPATLQSMCVNLVSQYTPAIIGYLTNQVPPSKICGLIKLCSQTSAPAKTLAVPSATNGIQCAVCEWIMTELESTLSSSSTEQEIINAVDNVCKLLPVSFQSMCVNIVGQYAPAIINYLVNKEPPSTVCAQIKLCDNAVAALAKAARVKKISAASIGSATPIL